MPVFTEANFDGHELISFCHDRGSGLRGIVAIHDTTLGPALGGCRMHPYGSEEEALADVLRLSRGMTYKAAMAGVPFGGGKSVIIGDPARDKTPALIAAFARRVDMLGGRYVMAEDVGTTVADMDVARRVSRHVVGTSAGMGDPSPATAEGVMAGIRAAMAHRGHDRLAGVRVAVQGLGKVGMRLCALLHEAGAELVVADLAPAAVAQAVDRYGARAVSTAAIVGAEADVFAPCALGGVIDDRALDVLRAGVVAGAANNQLAAPRCGEELARRGILYAPDYVINAGGLIRVAAEALGEGPDWVAARTGRIGRTLAEIFLRAEQGGLSTAAVADRMAEERLAAARAGRSAA